VHADGEFAPIKPLIESMPGRPLVNLVSVNDHIPEIERRIRVVKEQCQLTRHVLPFQWILKLLIVHIVLNVVKLLNIFPTKGGVSETLSPKTIMSGETLDYKKHLSLQFGQYCKVHDEYNHRNSQLALTKGAIYLGPSGNLQGGFKCMAFNTRKKIVRQNWDAIPIPDLVISRVNALGSGQPHHMTFTDQHGRPIGDTEIPGVDSSEEEDVHLAGVEPVIEDDIEIPGVDVEGPEASAPQSVEINDPDIPEDNPAPIQVAPTQEKPAPQASAPVTEPSQAPCLRRSTSVRLQYKHAYTPRMTGFKYLYAVIQMEIQGVLNPDAHMFVQEDFYLAEPDVVAAIMTQVSLKTGLKQWVGKAFTASHSDMKELHLRKTFKPKQWR
jgi:hypothetical protein